MKKFWPVLLVLVMLVLSAFECGESKSSSVFDAPPKQGNSGEVQPGLYSPNNPADSSRMLYGVTRMIPPDSYIGEGDFLTGDATETGRVMGGGGEIRNKQECPVEPCNTQ